MAGYEERERERSEDDLVTRLRENAVGIASVLVTGLWLAGLLTGQSWWLVALVVGYAAVIPVVAALFGDETEWGEWDEWGGESAETTSESTAETRDTGGRDALETIRDRYAAGDLTEDQFERKLEQLLATETLEDADEWVRDRAHEGRDQKQNRDATRDRDQNRDRDLEYDR